MSRQNGVRHAILGVFLALCAGPAWSLNRSGSLRWRFDDIELRSPSGRSHRSSWFQGYDLNLHGRLFNDALGTFKTGGSYVQGADINQAVNANVPGQRVLTYNASADLFNPRLRRYVQVSPNLSLQQMRLDGNGSSPTRTILTNGWGVATSVSLPRLPALSVSRQFNKVNDPLDVNPTDQRLSFQREQAAYSIGRFRFQGEHEFRRTEDRVRQIPSPTEDTRRGNFEYNHYDYNRHGLQSISMRSDYLRFASNGTPLQRSISGNLSVRSKELKTGAWTHSGNYWNDSQKDLLRDSAYTSHNGNLNSSRVMRSGTLGNSLSASLTNGRGGSARSAGTAPSLNISFRDGLAGLNLGGQAGWSRMGNGDRYFNDGLSGLLTLRRANGTSVFAEGRTYGVEPLRRGIPGGSRTQQVGIGGAQQWYGNEISTRFDRTYNKTYEQNFRSISDQFNVQGRVSPLDRFWATAGFTASIVHTTPGRKTTTRTYRAGLDYLAWSSLQLSADASYAGQNQYNSNVAASYQIGKTQLRVKYQIQELASAPSYSYVSVALTRLL